MSAEAKTVSLLVLMIVIAAGLVVWSEYSALVGMFDQLGQALDAATSRS